MQNYLIPGRREISTELNGKIYSGYYIVEKRLITVYYKCHSETTQNSYNNDVLAKIILGQLVRNFEND